MKAELSAWLSAIVIAAVVLSLILFCDGKGVGNDRVDVRTGDLHLWIAPPIPPPVRVWQPKTRGA